MNRAQEKNGVIRSKQGERIDVCVWEGGGGKVEQVEQITED